MAALIAAARQASKLARFSALESAATSRQTTQLVQRRGFAAGGDHHGPPKVNFWEDPMSPSKWKEEHFVLISLSGWGIGIYSIYKLFTKGKKETKEEPVKEASH